VKIQGHDIDKRVIETQNTASNAKKKLDGEMRFLSEMAAKIKLDLSSSKDNLAARVKNLQQLVESSINDFTKSQGGDSGGSFAESQGASQGGGSAPLDYESRQLISELQMNLKNSLQKIDAQEDSWKAKMDNEANGVEKSKQATWNAANDLVHTEEGSEGRMVQETGALSGKIDVNTQKVGTQMQNWAKGNTEGSSEQLGSQEALVGQFGKSKNGVAYEIGRMSNDFENELKYYKDAGRISEEQVGHQVKELEGRAPNLAAQFTEETQSSKHQLTDANTRFNKAVSETGFEMKAIREGLDRLRKQSKVDMTAVHGENSRMKRKHLNQMEANVAAMTTLKEGFNARLESLAEMQKGFNRGLTSVSGFEANQDEDKIAEMSNRAHKLEESTERLFSWQRSFKHRTLAWRAEVERAIRRLNGEIEGEEEEQREGFMNAEVNANTAARSTQRSVEGSVMRSAKTNAQRQNKLIDGMQGQMAAMLDKETGDQNSDENSIERLRGQMGANGNVGNRAMEDVAAKQQRLEFDSDLYRQHVATGKQQFDDKFMLQKHGLSEKNLRTDEYVKLTSNRLTSMASSFAETDIHADSDADEESALVSLNNELRRENDALEHRDDALDDKVSMVKKVLNGMQRKNVAA